VTFETLIDSKTALIFDLDGTLVDTSPMHASAFADVFTKLGITDFDYDEFAGRRTDDVIRTVLTRNGIVPQPELVKTLARRKQKSVIALIECKPGLLPGAKNFLLRMEGAGKRLALATSASRAGATASMRANGIEELFEIVITGDDAKNAKPAPDIYEMTIRSLGCNASSCLVFEDSEAGYAAARSAGLDTIIVVQDALRHPRWMPEGAYVSNFERLNEFE